MAGLITSRENEKVKNAVAIAASAALRRQEGMFFAETAKLVLDLAAFGALPLALFYTEEAFCANPGLAALCGEHFQISGPVAQKLATQKTAAGVYMLAKLPAQQPLTIQKNGRYLVLENVQDPANVGAMLRTAAAMGFSGVFTAGSCADPFSQKALRGSMGAAVKLPIWGAESAAETCNILKKNGIETVAAEMNGKIELQDYTPQNGVAVLVGSEGQGLSAGALSAVDVKVRIPMAAHTESLNAAVAAAIFMWQLRSL